MTTTSPTRHSGIDESVPPNGVVLPPVMTPEQARDLTGISLAQGRDGAGPRTINVLGTILVLREDLQAWLSER